MDWIVCPSAARASQTKFSALAHAGDGGTTP